MVVGILARTYTHMHTRVYASNCTYICMCVCALINKVQKRKATASPNDFILDCLSAASIHTAAPPYVPTFRSPTVHIWLFYKWHNGAAVYMYVCRYACMCCKMKQIKRIAMIKWIALGSMWAWAWTHIINGAHELRVKIISMTTNAIHTHPRPLHMFVCMYVCK